MKLSVIIPTYNEESSIEELIKRIESVCFPVEYEIIIVDDASTDATFEKEKHLQLNSDAHIKLIRSTINRGKGSCIREGIQQAIGDIIIIQDADLEYNPCDIPKLIEPIIAENACVVYGSRFIKNSYPYGMSLRCYIANRFLTYLTNMLYSVRLTDMETCYKAIKSDIIKNMDFKAAKFEFEPEITAMIIKRGIRILELSISYQGRTSREGKKIKMKDFFIAVLVLIRYRFYSSKYLKYRQICGEKGSKIY